MVAAEERLRVLKLVESGQVSAEEGVRLLEALQDGQAERQGGEPLADSPAKGPRRMRVLVTDLGTGQQKLDISLPWHLVSVGVNMGARFTPRSIDLDLEEVMAAVDAGIEGKVIEVEDEGDSERIEIFVEQ